MNKLGEQDPVRRWIVAQQRDNWGAVKFVAGGLIVLLGLMLSSYFFSFPF